jgi:sulfonate transport system permease protein
VTAGSMAIRLPRALVGWILPALVLVVWELLARTGFLQPSVLPAPTAVAAALGRVVRSGELLDNIAISFWRASIGFLIGGAVGFAFGLANGLSRFSEALTDTTLQMVRNVPHLALIPLVILWFYINTLAGIRSVDPQLVEMGRTYGMNGRDLFTRVILPGALPSIFVGVRFGLGIMWLTLIVAETIAASSGIGHMAMQAREFMMTDVVVLSILIYALLGKLADTVARILERRTLSWNPAFQSV